MADAKTTISIPLAILQELEREVPEMRLDRALSCCAGLGCLQLMQDQANVLPQVSGKHAYTMSGDKIQRKTWHIYLQAKRWMDQFVHHYAAAGYYLNHGKLITVGLRTLVALKQQGYTAEALLQHCCVTLGGNGEPDDKPRIGTHHYATMEKGEMVTTQDPVLVRKWLKRSVERNGPVYRFSNEKQVWEEFSGKVK